MAFRSLTEKYVQFRQDAHSRSEEKKKNVLIDIDDHPSSMRAQLNAMPPAYVKVTERVQQALQQIRSKHKVLKTLHDERLKISFGDEEVKKQQDVDVMTDEISRLFKVAEKGLKEVALIENDGNLPFEEKQLRMNVMKGFAMELQSLSKQFRSSQKEFVTRLKGIEDGLTVTDSMGNETEISIDEIMTAEKLSPESRAQLNEVMQRGDQRHKEIAKLVTQIADLAQLFQQLNQLIVEQGTIVDRIDHNVEVALSHVQAGNKKLVSAEKQSRAPTTLICIVALIITIIVLMAILINKFK